MAHLAIGIGVGAVCLATSSSCELERGAHVIAIDPVAWMQALENPELTVLPEPDEDPAPRARGVAV